MRAYRCAGRDRAGIGDLARYGQDWRRVRLAVLERDGFVCHWCFAPANTVDHVRPLALAGARLDPTNLVACCRSCSSRRGAAVANRRRSSLAPGSGYLTPTKAPGKPVFDPGIPIVCPR